MKLSDTVCLMNSNDWKDRFKAEYIQARIRLSKLEDAINNAHDIATLDSMQIPLMLKQRDAMESYLSCLEKRASIADIDLRLHSTDI